MVLYFTSREKLYNWTKKKCDVYGQEYRWFARFRSGNFDVEDGLRSGWLLTEKVDEIMKLVEVDWHLRSCDSGKYLIIVTDDENWRKYENIVHGERMVNYRKRLKGKIDVQ